MAKKFNIIPEIDELVMKAVNQIVWPRWRAKHEAMKRACYYKTVGHRRRIFYKCELCGREGLERGDVQTDHILPRVPVEGYDNLIAWLERTLCEADGLQVICKDPCHKEKTAKEAGQRAEVRRAAKAKSRKKKGKRK
jgi:hypothetical protein